MITDEAFELIMTTLLINFHPKLLQVVDLPKKGIW